ncbi:MAG: hypothetical protein IJV27_03545 [Prevotella sp.]|nr:hypothetical protein [Prevotella sp.]
MKKAYITPLLRILAVDTVGTLALSVIDDVSNQPSYAEEEAFPGGECSAGKSVWDD